MKYLTEYRDRAAIQGYLERLHAITTQPWTIMEVCGGQTHSIVRYRLQDLLPQSIHLVHGPGCPVCVTSLEMIDKALQIAAQPDVIFCSFGDMLRVPGSHGSLLQAQAEGADVRILYSPLDALALAKEHPNHEVVFFAVGFETTAPAIAMTIYQAQQQGIPNFSVLTSHFLVPPAMEAILSAPHCVVQGFLAAGHVCTVMGYDEYFPISAHHQVPIVVTGFEPLDLIEGLYLCIKQLEAGEARVENQYVRSVTQKGNPQAQQLLQEVFRVVPRTWRGIGEIPLSGLGLTEPYAKFDAATRFDVDSVSSKEDRVCISAEIMQGRKKPHDCPAFGKACTPETPIGAPMVSSEGACAAYYQYEGVHS